MVCSTFRAKDEARSVLFDSKNASRCKGDKEKDTTAVIGRSDDCLPSTLALTRSGVDFLVFLGNELAPAFEALPQDTEAIASLRPVVACHFSCPSWENAPINH